ncbi:MAG: ATP synthase F1 subunit gamma [Patescibacteria group bacterium]|nr:ATP synthase F1 subunit gamma [Patescibacteria group bacterium]
MISTRLIKKRIKSASNIAQITKAMEMVAASKMKKAQNLAISGKPYAQKIYQAVFELAKRCDPLLHPLLTRNVFSSKTLVVFISTNKGMCGGLNTNLFRAFLKWFNDFKDLDFITAGKKAETFVVRAKGNLTASFTSGHSYLEHAPAIISLVTEGFINNKYKNVIIVYNDFISALHQEPVKKQLLPLGIMIEDKTSWEEGHFSEFLVEPSYDKLLDALLPHYLENQLREAMIEAEASEHSARMLAMKNATDNAGDLMKELTLEYNKARQEKITYEIADMVTARMAVE